MKALKSKRAKLILSDDRSVVILRKYLAFDRNAENSERSFSIHFKNANGKVVRVIPKIVSKAA